MPKLEAALLDIDGTFLLSNDAHAHAWVDAYAEFGHDIPLEKIQPLIGMGGDKVMGKVTPGLNEHEGEGKQITGRRREIFLTKYAPSLQPAPGSRALVLRIRQQGLERVVVTSAKSDELKTLLKAAQIEDLVEEATTSNEADESKPAPDIVAVALEKSHKQPEDVVMLGDTPYDIESARGAGVGMIAMRCGGHSDQELAGALAIYDDPADLLAHYDESPLGHGTHVLSGAGQ